MTLDTLLCPACRWELGCLRYLHRHFDLSKVQLVGASAGGLIATLAACGVDEDKAVRQRQGKAASQAGPELLAAACWAGARGRARRLSPLIAC